MSQTAAILVDAYRELNAKKLFWVTLIISGVLVAAFALLGVTPTQLKLVTLEINVQNPYYWYKEIFSWLVGLWVAWGAVVLALISTAGIFPEFMAGGSIDLYFSKPMGRLRLFLTKWSAGLLFVVLQAGVFAAGAFLIFGIRSGYWLPSIFLIVPLVVCLFSYLYAVAVLFGVLTRSTVASILLTVLVWAIIAAGGWVERQLFSARAQQAFAVSAMEKDIADIDAKIKDLEENPSVTNTFGVRVSYLKRQRDQRAAEVSQTRQLAANIARWHDIAYFIASTLPKTTETANLFDRKLFSDEDLVARSKADRRFIKGMVATTEDDEEFQRQIELSSDAKLASQRAMRNRSVPWVLGTSLAFEAVLLVIAAWLFCRRDY